MFSSTDILKYEISYVTTYFTIRIVPNMTPFISVYVAPIHGI